MSKFIMPKNHYMQKGTAILIALFFMTIIASIATTLIFRQHLDIRRTTLMLTADQSYQYAQGVILWARAQLLQNGLKQKENKVVDIFPLPIPTKRYFAHVVRGEILDAQARFNLNNLEKISTKEKTKTADDADKKSDSDKKSDKPEIKDEKQPLQIETKKENGKDEEKDKDEDKDKKHYTEDALVFLRLIRQVDPKTSEENATKILENISKWLSNPKQFTDRQNALIDKFYLQQQPPYRAARTQMIDTSELLLVQGVDENLYEKLKPYITALPKKTKININTAPIPVLMSLSKKVDESMARSIIANRVRDGGFVKIKDFLALENLKEAKIPKDLITAYSDYFYAMANISSSDQSLVIRSLLYRKNFKRVQSKQKKDEDESKSSEDETQEQTENNAEKDKDKDKKDKKTKKEKITVQVLWEEINFV